MTYDICRIPIRPNLSLDDACEVSSTLSSSLKDDALLSDVIRTQLNNSSGSILKYVIVMIANKLMTTIPIV